MLLSKKDYFNQKRNLETLIAEAMIKCESILDKRQAESIKAIKETTLESQRFPIVFAGRFSVGKSLLINSLFLDADILPTNIKPTTARNVVIRYGEEKKFIVYKNDPDADKIISEELPANQEAIRQYCTHFGDKKDAYEYFELVLPLDFLKSGVVIVDTVGTEDIDDKYVSHTINAFNEAAAIVYVTDALQPLAQSEKDFIAERLRDSSKRLFLVANKSDGRSPDEIKEIQADLKRRFEDFYCEKEIRAGDRIFMVSGKTGDGLDDLKTYLLKFIQEERVKEIVTQSASDVKNVFHNALSGLENELHTCSLQVNKEEDKILNLKEDQHQIDLVLDQIKNEKMSKLDELVEYGSSVIENAVNEAKDIVMGRVGNFYIDFSMLSRFIATEVQRTLSKAMMKIAAKTLHILAERMEIVRPDLKDSLQLLKQELFHIENKGAYSIHFGSIAQSGGVFGALGGLLMGIHLYATAATACSIPSILSGIGGGAIVGAGVGSVLGPIGAIGGAVVAGAGACLGAITGGGIGAAFGGSSVMGALTSAIPVAGPIILGSGLAFYLGKVLKENAEKTKHVKTTVAIETIFDDILRVSREDIYGKLETFFNQLVDAAISKQTEEKRKLEAILNTSDLGSLKERIKTLEVDGEILRNYIVELNTFVEA